MTSRAWRSRVRSAVTRTRARTWLPLQLRITRPRLDAGPWQHNLWVTQAWPRQQVMVLGQVTKKADLGCLLHFFRWQIPKIHEIFLNSCLLSSNHSILNLLYNIIHHDGHSYHKNDRHLALFVSKLCYQAKIVQILELRQYKNDSIQSKIIPTLKLPLFFTTYTVRGKARQFQNWNYFWLNGIFLILSLL